MGFSASGDDIHDKPGVSTNRIFCADTSQGTSCGVRVVVGARDDVANEYIGNAEVPRRELMNELFPVYPRAFRVCKI